MENIYENDIWNVRIKDTSNELPIPEYTFEQPRYVVLDPGEYPYEIINAEAAEYVPKEGSKIPHCVRINLTVKVKGQDKDFQPAEALVYENLYCTDRLMWKVVQFAKSAHIENYEEMGPAELANAALGATGMVRIRKGKTPKGYDRNEVQRWNETSPLKAEPTVTVTNTQVAPSINSADLPF